MTTGVSSGQRVDAVRGRAYLDTDHLLDGFGRRVFRGSALTLVAQAAGQLVNLGAIVVLSRLLTPEQHGVVAMATALTDFLRMFRDLGTGVVTVQRDDISPQQINTLFWLNVAAGLAFAIAASVSAPTIGRFYGDLRLVQIINVLGLTFVVGGLGVQHQALLTRQMSFGTLAVIDSASLALQALVRIALALLGFGYWSLVGGVLTREVALTISVWTACRWRPGQFSLRCGLRSLLAFGASSSAANVLNHASKQIDQVLVGRVWGGHSLGLYTKAHTLLQIPASFVSVPAASIAIPALSRVQDKPDQFRRTYLLAVNIIALLTMPLSTIGMAVSHDLLGVVLGDQWVSASRALTFLGVGSLLYPIYATHRWVNLALGRGARLLTWSGASVLAIGIGVAVGMRYGIAGVAAGYSLAIAAITPLALHGALRPVGLGFADVLREILLPLGAAGLAGCSAALVSSLPIAWSAAMRLAVSASIGAVVYLLTIFLWPSGREQRSRYLSFGRALIAWAQDAAAALRAGVAE